MQVSPLTLEHREPWAGLLAAAFGRSPSEMACALDRLHSAYTLIARGAWYGTTLAAQYCCLLTTLHAPNAETPVRVGMSINMAVHPAYRGRGLIKQMARPVYETVAAQGGVAGVGFSNAAGVQVDRHSKEYGYRIVGRMVPTLAWLSHCPDTDQSLRLTQRWAGTPLHCTPDDGIVRFVVTPESIRYRFIEHPFRRYHFGVWATSTQTRGVVIYRPIHRKWIPGVTLLAAYSDDLTTLISRWAGAMWQQGMRWVHVLTSPASPLLAALKRATVCVALPYSRSPYYLTVKPLREDTSACLFDFSRWDCVGGDIL